MSMPSDPNPIMGIQYFCHYPGCSVPLTNGRKHWCQLHKKEIHKMSPYRFQELELIPLITKKQNRVTARVGTFLSYVPLLEVWRNKKCPRCGHSLSGPFNVQDPHNETISLDCLACGFHTFLSRPRNFAPPHRDREDGAE